MKLYTDKTIIIHLYSSCNISFITEILGNILVKKIEEKTNFIAVIFGRTKN